MAKYPKTTGQLVTTRIKIDSALNGGRMLLDDQLKEMFNIMLPVAELKTMMSDEVDAWIEKMAEYGQEWCEPDGRLLKCTDYPELFALIGYNYGWSNTNPNGTTTYSFTDNNGTAKSLVLYNDLDIDGNALAVSGTPAYFRIPNLAGRFLRCAGTASYVNKWTDTDGTVRQLLTEYKAEMYKGQLDAQRGISGRIGNNEPWSNRGFTGYGWNTATGAFPKLFIGDMAIKLEPGNEYLPLTAIRFDSSAVVPISLESNPSAISVCSLIRIA